MSLKNEIENKLAELINPIGQNYSVDFITCELMKLIDNYDGSTFDPPEITEIVNYITEKNLMNEKTIATIKKTGEMFLDYYSARGWKIGKHKMKNWKKALNNWCKRGWTIESENSKVENSVEAYLLIQNLKK